MKSMHGKPKAKSEFLGFTFLPFVILRIDETRTEAEPKFKEPVTEAEGEVVDIVGSEN